MGNILIKIQMGGVSTVPVDCAALTDAETIDATITSYIADGLVPEAEIMIYYGWYWWAMYIWHLNMWSYISKIEAIALCGVSNGVDDATFNEEWMNDTLYPTMMDYYDNVWFLTEYWWAAALLGWTGIILIIVNVIFMLDFQAYAMEYNNRLLGLSAGGDGEEEEEEE